MTAALLFVGLLLFREPFTLNLAILNTGAANPENPKRLMQHLRRDRFLYLGYPVPILRDQLLFTLKSIFCWERQPPELELNL